MQNTRSPLERRVAQLLATTPPLAARRSEGHIRIDLVYLSERDQDLLTTHLRQ